MKKTVLLLLGILVFICGFNTPQSSNIKTPKGWPKPVYNFSKNPLSKEKVDLGRMLFYDPILSRDSSVSCSSCHSQYVAFTHVDHAVSHGIANLSGTRNAPALMNLAWHRDFMWDGAINHLDMQALAPISNKTEMDEQIEHVVQKIQASQRYPILFKTAFGDSIITGERVLKSISQFMLTLISSNAKYDSVKRGETIFTEQETNGYRLFKKLCDGCHTEPLFTNDRYENNGLALDSFYKDYGRMKVTMNPDDSLKFKVPTLRNIEFSYPYMHDGRFKKLSDVLQHYTTRHSHSRTLAKQLQEPLRLSSNDKVDITAFLLTLTDRKFLFDTAFSYPKNFFRDTPQVK